MDKFNVSTLDVVALEDINLLDVGNSLQLAGSIWADGDTAYLCFLPDEVEHGVTLSCLVMSTDDWKKFLRQSDIMETEVMAEAADGSLTKALLRKSSRQIDQKISWAVYKRDNYTCRYCGRDDVPLTVDHLILWENGGPSIEENLVAACKKCNKTRGNMEYANWLKSPKYKRISELLSIELKSANIGLLQTLKKVPVRVHKQSR